MKTFEIPEVKVVHFDSSDIITSSSVCDCDDCPGGCPEGSNNCPCDDFFSTYQ